MSRLKTEESSPVQVLLSFCYPPRRSRHERINPHQLLLFTEAEIQQLADQLEQAKQTAEGTSDDEPNGKALDDGSEVNGFTDDDSTGDKPSGKDKRAQRNHRGRRRLPANMPREILRHELSKDERKCPCCGDLRKEFGVEVSEQMEYVPAHWKAIEHQSNVIHTDDTKIRMLQPGICQEAKFWPYHGDRSEKLSFRR